MSGKRLPEEDYDAIIGEVEAYLREHLPKEVLKGDRSLSRSTATFRIRMVDAEGRAIFEPEMSQLEIREEFCRNVIALAKGGDKQAKVDLKMMEIDFLDDVIAGGDDATPRELLQYIRDELVSSLPYEADQLRTRDVQIAIAVDMVLTKLPGIRRTRNRASGTAKHAESACSLVVKALERVGCFRSESAVQGYWENFGVGR